MRKIIHIDMDCFYAAVEIRDRPELASKPVAVGGTSRRGVLTTCNYVARKYGCRSGMPGFKALELCPHLVLLPTHFEKYRKESLAIREIFAEYTEIIEPLSLDEAFLDVSHITDRYAWDIAKEIRAKIKERTSLTASAGIAPNKMLAKIASDWKKPDGQFAITPPDVKAFMKTLPVGKIWGVGKKTQERFQKLGIETCGDLQRWSEMEMDQRMGKFGRELYRLCRGIDEREVVVERERKSMSNERTFFEDILDVEEALVQMALLCDELATDLKKSKHRDRDISKIFVKLKFSDFKSTTKETIADRIDPFLFEPLLREAWLRGNGKVRLIGTGVRFASAPQSVQEQMQLKFTTHSEVDGVVS